jgi:predicted DNA repair protein MutK
MDLNKKITPMGSGFFTLLDDIAALMDDVAAMSKIATKKTAGILGDDLAVNAEKASGFVSSREIPVLWAITKGSFLNKLIILPIAFLLSAFAPWAVTMILLLGAIYLAYEGAEKIYEYLFPQVKPAIKIKLEKRSETEILALEKVKIKSAIVTDFILSVEIVIIALGTVLEETIFNQIVVVSIVAVIATIGVYGIVALIVRMDDLGMRLIQLSDKKKSISKMTGTLLVQTLPIIIKSLSVIGTIALILVAGGICIHNIHFIEELLGSLPSIIAEFIVGLLVGFTSLTFFKLFNYVFLRKKSTL